MLQYLSIIISLLKIRNLNERIDMSEEQCPPRPACEKKDGSQDHRCNTGDSRTPAQKVGDDNRKKD